MQEGQTIRYMFKHSLEGIEQLKAKRILIILMVVLAGTNLSAFGAEPPALFPTRGHVLMIRHAVAPGSGDPVNFRIGDCSTQRNLSDQGRVQAGQIGDWLLARDIPVAGVYSSQWCRCLETAERMNLAPVKELAALNSFYERPQDREPNMNALRAFLNRQPVDGNLIILVTHYVNIAALTGIGVSSGEGILLKLNGNGKLAVVQRLDFGL